jgi:hypothetical protein
MYRAVCVACLEPTGWWIKRLSEMPYRKHYCRECWREVRRRE